MAKFTAPFGGPCRLDKEGQAGYLVQADRNAAGVYQGENTTKQQNQKIKKHTNGIRLTDTAMA